jgi:hypothetical protein
VETGIIILDETGIIILDAFSGIIILDETGIIILDAFSISCCYLVSIDLIIVGKVSRNAIYIQYTYDGKRPYVFEEV